MRACFIGNSYVIALKDGLALAPSPLTGNVTFVCAPGSELRMRVEPQRIVPLAKRTMIAYADGITPGDVALSDYELFVVVGLGFGPGVCGRIYRHWRQAHHATGGRRLISGAALTAAMTGLLKQSIAARIATQLRQHTARPIYLVPQPMVIGSLRGAVPTIPRTQEAIEAWKPMFDDTVAADLYGTYRRAAALAADELGATFLEQPPRTRQPVFTRDEYRLIHRHDFHNAPREKIEVEDYGHMNARFGREVIADLEAAVLPANGAAPGAQPAVADAAPFKQSRPARRRSKAKRR
jgi:hypothetical protein